MLKNTTEPAVLRPLLLSMLSLSGTLAGISLALVGFAHSRAIDKQAETLADDLYLLAALGFVVVCYCVFFAVRNLAAQKLRYWTSMIDWLFLGSLTLLLFAGAVTLYEFV